MALGSALWKASESFYNGLTLAQHGITPEQAFARRLHLASAFPRLEEFWKKHVCPMTTRPQGMDFRPGHSLIAEKIGMASYSVMGRLLDSDDSMAKVRAGDLGERYRNWRDAIEAAGNALQLTTELQYAVEGNPKNKKAPSLASTLGVAINLFPDWQLNWAANRDMATKYRHYLVHEGLVYTVQNQATGEVLVLGYQAFKAGGNWNDASASYYARPGDWQTLQRVGEVVLGNTIAFIDLTYERLLASMDGLLVNPAYQQLWGWDNNTPPAAWPVRPPAPTLPAMVNGVMTLSACSSSKKVYGPTIISSGGCNP